MVQPELRRFTVPILHGFVFILGSSINGHAFSFVVISRRSAHRAGVYGEGKGSRWRREGGRVREGESEEGKGERRRGKKGRGERGMSERRGGGEGK